MALVTPELGLVPEDILITPIRVETQRQFPLRMVTETSNLWDIFWCSKLFEFMQGFTIVNKLSRNQEFPELWCAEGTLPFSAPPPPSFLNAKSCSRIQAYYSWNKLFAVSFPLHTRQVLGREEIRR